MLSIFKGSSKDVNVQWFEKFTADNNDISIPGQQFINFLQIVEQKSENAKDREALAKVREKLVELYRQTGRTGEAAQTLGKLLSNAETGEKKDEYFIRLLKIYLQTGEFAKVKDLINNRLLEEDFQVDSRIIKVLEDFISNSESEKTERLLGELNEIKVEKRPFWEEKLSGWNSEVTGDKEPVETTKPPEDSNQPA